VAVAGGVLHLHLHLDLFSDKEGVLFLVAVHDVRSASSPTNRAI
jgi:hypothetical protein